MVLQRVSKQFHSTVPGNRVRPPSPEGSVSECHLLDGAAWEKVHAALPPLGPAWAACTSFCLTALDKHCTVSLGSSRLVLIRHLMPAAHTGVGFSRTSHTHPELLQTAPASQAAIFGPGKRWAIHPFVKLGQEWEIRTRAATRNSYHDFTLKKKKAALSMKNAQAAQCFTQHK